MNKYKIACQVSKMTGKPLKDVIPIVNGVFKVMGATILDDERISVSDLGSFSLKVRKQKNGYDPYRKRHMVIPESKCLKFEVSPSLQRKIKTKYDKNP